MNRVIEIEHISYVERLQNVIDRAMRKAYGCKFAGLLDEYDRAIRVADNAAKQLSRLQGYHVKHCQT